MNIRKRDLEVYMKDTVHKLHHEIAHLDSMATFPWEDFNDKINRIDDMFKSLIKDQIEMNKLLSEERKNKRIK